MPRQAGQPLPPAESGAAAPAAESGDGQSGNGPEGAQGDDEAADSQQTEAKIAGHQHDQAGQQKQTQGVAAEQEGLRRAEFAAQHTQGRHPGQLQQRRKNEAEKQHAGHTKADHRRRPARIGQFQRQQGMQPADQDEMGGEAEQATEQRAQQRQPQEERRMQAQQPAVRHAQAAHDGTGIEMALHVAPAGQGDGDGGEDDGQHRCQAQKAFGPVDRRADFRPRVGHLLQPFAAGQSPAQPVTKRSDRAVLAGDQQSVTDPRTGLHQPGGRNVVHVHQQARRQAEEIDAAIRFLDEDGGDEKLPAPDGDHPARRGAQGAGQTFVEPDRAGLWAAGDRGAVDIDRRQLPAQADLALLKLCLQLARHADLPVGPHQHL